MDSNWSGNKFGIRKFENRDFKNRFVSGYGLRVIVEQIVLKMIP